MYIACMLFPLNPLCAVLPNTLFPSRTVTTALYD